MLCSMFPIGCLCKRALKFHYFGNALAVNHRSPLLHHQPLHDSSPALRVRFLSVSPTSQIQNHFEEKEQSMDEVVSYLVDSCGLSLDSAIYACNRVRLVNLENPVAVVQLLKTHGFSQTQISAMVRSFPQLIVSDPEKTLVPKLNYLYSVGASRADIVRIFSNCPYIFGRSLEKHIIPSFDLLRDLAGTNKNAIATIRRCGMLLYVDLQEDFIQNVKTLGYKSAPCIFTMLNCRPSSLLVSSLSFAKSVEKVKTFGFSSSSKPTTFARALIVMTSMSESKWEQKLRIFQRWGWSVDLTYQAFRKFPHCLTYSEEKINSGMHFYVNKAGVEASYVAQYPTLLGYSLEKRVIPRYTIYQILLSRGLVKNTGLSFSLVNMSNQYFKKKFVSPYLEEAPELLDLYYAKSPGYQVDSTPATAPCQQVRQVHSTSNDQQPPAAQQVRPTKNATGTRAQKRSRSTDEKSSDVKAIREAISAALSGVSQLVGCFNYLAVNEANKSKVVLEVLQIDGLTNSEKLMCAEALAADSNKATMFFVLPQELKKEYCLQLLGKRNDI